MHVVGKEYFVKLEHDTAYYQAPDKGESEVNKDIYSKLNEQLIDWTIFDNWEYHSNGTITNNPDGVIDMIYKVHRYKYENIFSEGNASGFCYLGKANNTWQYLVDPNNMKYVYGGFPNYSENEMKGSGLTIAGNTTSSVLTKGGVIGRIWHEHGHYTYGTVHGRIGLMGDLVWDPFMCLTEKIHINYESPYYSNTAYEEKILGDISGRSTSNASSIRVQLTSGEILIANRNKISKWDSPMLGDTAYGDFLRETNYGQGIYFYHISGLGPPNSILEDIECSDGLWNWVQDGFAAPDWAPNSPILPILNRTIPRRDLNDNGQWVNVNQYPNTVKDGLTIRGYTITNSIESKWFSIGKKRTSTTDGIDRIFTNYEENWTSRENQIDRWDAWTKGEIFSRYSSPSTTTYNDENSGVFIWIKDFDNSTKLATIRIYRDIELYPENGCTESYILAETPPSKPMGIKIDRTACIDGKRYPIISWSHNTEPDMLPDLSTLKRYKVFRAFDGINTVPQNWTEIADVTIDQGTTPTYTDLNAYGECFGSLWGDVNRIRYKIKAVDKTNWASVYSDFVSITTEFLNRRGGGDSPEFSFELPKQFNLSQNYPNPFNPVTKINFALPKQGFVTLIIYDITGREVKTLISEVKQAGYYSVDFNGSSLSSGVYFYKIQSGDFISVKRMVLIK
jgi:Secretion system C-terminal sorting domain